MELLAWLEMCPEKPRSTVANGVQNRGSKFVCNIYLNLIYRIGIYRYKRNQQNCCKTIQTLLMATSEDVHG